MTEFEDCYFMVMLVLRELEFSHWRCKLSNIVQLMCIHLTSDYTLYCTTAILRMNHGHSQRYRRFHNGMIAAWQDEHMQQMCCMHAYGFHVIKHEHVFMNQTPKQHQTNNLGQQASFSTGYTN